MRLIFVILARILFIINFAKKRFFLFVAWHCNEKIARMACAKSPLIKKAQLAWRDTLQDHTNRISLLVSQEATFTDLRQYYFSHCKDYCKSPRYSLKITVKGDVLIKLDFVNNLLTINSDFVTVDEIFFNIVDIEQCLDMIKTKQLLESGSGTDILYAETSDKLTN